MPKPRPSAPAGARGSVPAALALPVPSPPGEVAFAGPPAQSGYPGAGSTGVPSGTKLTTYSGPCTVSSDNTVIEAKTVNCDLTIRAKNVTIRHSKVNGQITNNEGTSYSFTLEDSEVDAGFGQYAAVGTTNMTLLRANIHGGVTSVYCYANCSIRDSYLHGQRLDPSAPWHLGAFLANDNGNDPGGRTNANLQHNTIVCDAVPNPNDGGCSGDVNLYGDFGPITYVTINNNYLGSNTGVSYCLYGGESSSKPYPHADHVVVTNNVFGRGSNSKCGAYGPVTGYDPSRPGNVFSNNVWSDGKSVSSEN